MRAYIITTGVVFALLCIAHIWRAIVEPSARSPEFIVIILIAAALAVWAATVLRRSGANQPSAM